MNIVSDRSSFVIELDSAVYNLVVCKKACYALMQYVSCVLSVEGNLITITATPVSGTDKDVEEIKGLLADELLDYSLREEIFDRTETVRDLILSNAFSNTKLVG